MNCTHFMSAEGDIPYFQRRYANTVNALQHLEQVYGEPVVAQFCKERDIHPLDLASDVSNDVLTPRVLEVLRVELYDIMKAQERAALLTIFRELPDAYQQPNILDVTVSWLTELFTTAYNQPRV